MNDILCDLCDNLVRSGAMRAKEMRRHREAAAVGGREDLSLLTLVYGCLSNPLQEALKCISHIEDLTTYPMGLLEELDFDFWEVGDLDETLTTLRSLGWLDPRGVRGSLRDFIRGRCAGSAWHSRIEKIGLFGKLTTCMDTDKRIWVQDSDMSWRWSKSSCVTHTHRDEPGYGWRDSHHMTMTMTLSLVGAEWRGLVEIKSYVEDDHIGFPQGTWTMTCDTVRLGELKFDEGFSRIITNSIGNLIDQGRRYQDLRTMAGL